MATPVGDGAPSYRAPELRIRNSSNEVEEALLNLFERSVLRTVADRIAPRFEAIQHLLIVQQLVTIAPEPCRRCTLGNHLLGDTRLFDSSC